MGNIVQSVAELWRFLERRSRVWMWPIILVGLLLLLGAVLLAGQRSDVAPIIHVLL